MGGVRGLLGFTSFHFSLLMIGPLIEYQAYQIEGFYLSL